MNQRAYVLAQCYRLSLFIALLLGGMLSAYSQVQSTQDEGVSFGLIGDMGYRPAEEPLMQNVLDDINRAS
jgi:hypothetical protein